MRIRRVVTGTAGGRSVIVADEHVDPVTVARFPGAEFHRLWAADGPVALPTDGAEPVAPTHFPPAGGFRFGMFTMAPDAGAPDAEAPAEPAEPTSIAEIRRKLPGLLETLEPGGGGWHSTDTIDLNLIVSGEVWLLLDDGLEVLLRAGECVVQNGTRHTWRNRGPEPCVMAVAQVGMPRESSSGGAGP